jgi:Zn-dependent protease/CBS domain-containing protein
VKVGGIRIGRIAGIDILIHPSWFLIYALLTWSLSEGLFLEEHPGWGRTGAWTAGLVTSLLLFGSLLLHEFSHCYVARRLGLEVRSVTLFIFGGVSSLKGEPNEPADEFRIAIVGPITSFTLASVFGLAGLALWGTGADTAAFYLAVINAILGVFNLLPGFPLDGGRVLRAALWARSHSLQVATRIASQTGTATAFVLMGTGVVFALAGSPISGIWLIVIGWFLKSQAEASYSQLVTRDVLDRTPVLAVLEPDYHAVHPRTSLDALVNSYLLHYSQRYFPVSTDYGLEGLITVTDLQRVPRQEWHSRTVADAMTPTDRLHTLAPNDSLSRAAELIAANDVNQLPVIDEGHLLGFVTRGGIMRILQLREEEGISANKQTDPETVPNTSEEQTSDGVSAPKDSAKLGPKHPAS